MAHDTDTRHRVRHAYIESRLSIEVIAALFNISARTIHRWKEDSKQHGDDWDKAQGVALLAGEEMENTTRHVLAALVFQIKSAIELMNADDNLTPSVKVQLLASLADALYKSVAASKRLMPQTSKHATAHEVMKKFIRFVQLHHREQAAIIINIIDPFTAQLARELNE